MYDGSANGGDNLAIGAEENTLRFGLAVGKRNPPSLAKRAFSLLLGHSPGQTVHLSQQFRRFDRLGQVHLETG